MVHVYIPGDLIDKVRPMVETLWEREQREEKKKSLSPTDVVMRCLNKAYDASKRRPPQ